MTANAFLEFIKNYDQSIAEKLNVVTDWLNKKSAEMQEKNDAVQKLRANSAILTEPVGAQKDQPQVGIDDDLNRKFQV